MKWTDGTSYSQGDKEKLPRVWNAKAGKLNICVHRHIDYGNDVWLFSGLGIFDKHVLNSKDIESAKKEALGLAKMALARAIDSLI